jgi:hypothetical protein
MDQTKEHQQLVDDLLYAVGSSPYARVWKQINGLFVPYSTFKRVLANPMQSNFVRPIHVGVNGAADIAGILKNGHGTRLEIEAKTGNAVQSTEQKAYQAMIQEFGGVYILAHSTDEALTEIKRVLNFHGTV